jgi:hypothetical protein
MFLQKQKVIAYDKDISGSVYYTIAQGMHPRYTDEIFELDFWWKPTKEQDNIFKTYIAQKFKEYGFGGYVKLLFIKIGYLLSGDFRHPLDIKHSGALNPRFLILLIGVVLGMISLNKKQDGTFDFGLFLRMSLLSLICMELIIESSPRYIITFLPIFCIVSAHGYVALFERKWYHKKCKSILTES